MCFIFQGSVAKKPYNPIIGETFHCSWKIPPDPSGGQGDNDRKPYLMTYCAEQVSHHPPGKMAVIILFLPAMAIQNNDLIHHNTVEACSFEDL